MESTTRCTYSTSSTTFRNRLPAPVEILILVERLPGENIFPLRPNRHHNVPPHSPEHCLTAQLSIEQNGFTSKGAIFLLFFYKLKFIIHVQYCVYAVYWKLIILYDTVLLYLQSVSRTLLPKKLCNARKHEVRSNKLPEEYNPLSS